MSATAIRIDRSVLHQLASNRCLGAPCLVDNPSFWRGRGSFQNANIIVLINGREEIDRHLKVRSSFWNDRRHDDVARVEQVEQPGIESVRVDVGVVVLLRFAVDIVHEVDVGLKLHRVVALHVFHTMRRGQIVHSQLAHLIARELETIERRALGFRVAEHGVEPEIASRLVAGLVLDELEPRGDGVVRIDVELVESAVVTMGEHRAIRREQIDDQETGEQSRHIGPESIYPFPAEQAQRCRNRDDAQQNYKRQGVSCAAESDHERNRYS